MLLKPSFCPFGLAALLFVGLNLQYSFGQDAEVKLSTATQNEFLGSLEGTWKMEGRFRPTANSSWIPTGSVMRAERRSSDLALVREIEAKQISFTALDVLWQDKKTKQFTYVYFNSRSPDAIVMKGFETGTGEITVRSDNPQSRTVIRLVSPDKMIAQDFQTDTDGKEWMSREVNHIRIPNSEADNLEQLIGTWKVDLRPTPDADPYFQEMKIASAEGKSIQGTFYGAKIEKGRLNLDWGAIRFSFVTKDSSGEYHSSGTLKNGQIEGMTHSIGREFLSYWTAEIRQPDNKNADKKR